MASDASVDNSRLEFSSFATERRRIVDAESCAGVWDVLDFTCVASPSGDVVACP
jgi:hypothetical protein